LLRARLYGRVVAFQDNTSTSETSVLVAALPAGGVATLYSYVAIGLPAQASPDCSG
jgi:hypothetical protein